MKNLFLELTDEQLRDCFSSYEIWNHSIGCPQDCLLDKLREQYVEFHCGLGVHNLITDLLYTIAIRWAKEKGI